MHLSYQQDTKYVPAGSVLKYFPWSRAEDPDAPYKYKLLVQLRVNSNEANPENKDHDDHPDNPANKDEPEPEKPSTKALEILNDAIDDFFKDGLKLGAPADFLTKFAHFMSEYRGPGTKYGPLDQFYKSLIPGKGFLSTLMTGVFHGIGGSIEVVTNKVGTHLLDRVFV